MFDALTVAGGIAVTALLAAALLYWIDQEWRERDRDEAAKSPTEPPRSEERV